MSQVQIKPPTQKMITPNNINWADMRVGVTVKQMKTEGQSPATSKNYLFPSAKPGTHITKNYAKKILQEALKRAKINKKIVFHTLRRSYATHLHEASYSLRDIQELMGHTSSKTTERHIRVSNKPLSQIQNPLDNLAGLSQQNNFNINTTPLKFSRGLKQSPLTNNSQPVMDRNQFSHPYNQDIGHSGDNSLPYN